MVVVVAVHTSLTVTARPHRHHPPPPPPQPPPPPPPPPPPSAMTPEGGRLRDRDGRAVELRAHRPVRPRCRCRPCWRRRAGWPGVRPDARGQLVPLAGLRRRRRCLPVLHHGRRPDAVGLGVLERQQDRRGGPGLARALRRRHRTRGSISIRRRRRRRSRRRRRRRRRAVWAGDAGEAGALRWHQHSHQRLPVGWEVVCSAVH